MDSISNDHFDTAHFHSPGKMSRDGDIIIATNFHDSTAQHLDDLAY